MSEEKKILSCPKCKSQNIKRTRGVYWCADCGCEWRLTEEEPPKTQSLTIRNSTAEFLIFQAQSQANGVEVMYADETIWCTQDAIAALFDKSRTTITEHLQNIFYEGELQKDSVCRKFRRTAADGKDWAKHIDKFLTMDDRPILLDNGSVSAEDAKEFAESEFEKYRIIQDRLFRSDFDDEIEGLLSDKKD